MIFGVLTICLGCLCGLFVVLLLAGEAIQAAAPQLHDASHADFKAVIPALFMYVVLGVTFIWLGIGSIMKHRWARALLLLISWSWLVVGVLAMVMMAILMPKLMTSMQANMPSNATMSPAAMTVMMIVLTTIYGFIFVVIPAIWTFFYNSRHVKATCEASNPAPCWTDACPLPVLAICLWAVFSVGTMLLMPFAANGVFPFFGTFLTGMGGTATWMILGGLWGCSGWLMYKLDLRGWWLLLISMVLLSISTTLTYSLHDITEAYQLMGYSEAQIEQIKTTGLGGRYLAWTSLLFTVPLIVYLLFIKRYFRKV